MNLFQNMDKIAIFIETRIRELLNTKNWDEFTKHFA